MTVLLIISGAMGSLYSTEIRAATPFEWHWPGDGEFEFYALVFWCFVVVTSFLYFLRASAGQQAQDELVEVLRSQPPSDLLGVFKETYEKCVQVANVRGDSSADELATKIRAVLSGLGTLAKRFDGEGEAVRYATNIMLFIPTKSLSTAEQERLEAFLLYRDPETSLDRYRGMLLLQPELSTVVPTGEPDSDIKTIAFQIPHAQNLKSPGGKWRVIPGAPMAFVEGECDAYADSKDLVSWVKENTEFGDGFRTSLDAYFRNDGSQVQSFVSLPMGDLGVINIHRSRPGMLKAEQKLKHFLPLVAPFVLLLQGLVKDWTAARQTVQSSGSSTS